MAKKLVLTSHEIEFLRLMGVTYKDGTFTEDKTGNTFEVTIKESHNDNGRLMYTSYIHRASVFSMFEIIRHAGKTTQPNLVLIPASVGPYNYFLQEYPKTRDGHQRLQVGRADKTLKVESSLNVESAQIPDWYSKIYAVKRDMDVYWLSEKTYGVVNYDMRKMCEELCKPDSKNYSEALEEVIHQRFSDTLAEDFYLSMMPMILETFANTLVIPEQYKENIEQQFNKQEKLIESEYARTIEQAKQKRQERLEQLKAMRELLPTNVAEAKAPQKKLGSKKATQ